VPTKRLHIEPIRYPSKKSRGMSYIIRISDDDILCFFFFLHSRRGAGLDDGRRRTRRYRRNLTTR
jgi:hypothetical protein